jgi:ribosome biogenesis SPOUT family RNA methylase Rps3
LEDIPYIDFPELKFNKNESTEMPFRYVKDPKGKPIMPKVSTVYILSKEKKNFLALTFSQGMFELIKYDSEKSLEDLL